MAMALQRIHGTGWLQQRHIPWWLEIALHWRAARCAKEVSDRKDQDLQRNQSA